MAGGTAQGSSIQKSIIVMTHCNGQAGIYRVGISDLYGA